jgi:hypothetical protein
MLDGNPESSDAKAIGAYIESIDTGPEQIIP